MGAREVIGALKRAGFVEDRQSGSHLTLIHAATGRRATVPRHRGDPWVGTVESIIRQAGLTVEEFTDLLR